MINRFLTKIALNRYEKHLYNGGSTGSTNPHSAINRASEFLGAAKSSGPAGNGWVNVNRGQDHGTFTKGHDTLTREPGHYSKVNQERKQGLYRLEGNKPGQSKGPGVQVNHLDVEKITPGVKPAASAVRTGTGNRFLNSIKAVGKLARV